VHPHRPWDTAAAPRPDRAVLPPLLRGYLRLGARVCGPPAHDPDFGAADFLVLLDLEAMDPRYARHFLGAGA
jgi:putative hemolysin